MTLSTLPTRMLLAAEETGMPGPPDEPVDPPSESDGVLSEIIGIALAAGIFFSFIGLLACFVILSWDESDFGRVNRQTLAQMIKWLFVIISVSCLGEIVNVLFFWQPL